MVLFFGGGGGVPSGLVDLRGIDRARMSAFHVFPSSMHRHLDTDGCLLSCQRTDTRHGFLQVLVADDASLEHHQAEPLSALLVSLQNSCVHELGPRSGHKCPHNH
jgi:hypothetical protein